MDIQYNNYTVPTGNDKYFRIAGLDDCVTLPAFVAKAFYCEKMNRGMKSGFRITFIYDPSENLILSSSISNHKMKLKTNPESTNYLNVSEIDLNLKYALL